MTLCPRACLALPALAIALVLSGCSTPRHSNVLIFGTNTKFALDVSQDMTSGVGVTLGYKREEAVWMPLLPNVGDTAGETCTTPDCRKYMGNEGSNRDTYSVLASFGVKAKVGTEGQPVSAKVQGDIAQYFATGLAARALAQSGGAGLVNTNSDTLTAAQKATVEKESQAAVSELEQVIGKVTSAGAVDPAKLNVAFSKAPGSTIPASTQAAIKTARTEAELRDILSAFKANTVVRSMFQTLP